LARVSLSLLGVFATSGCIVTDSLDLSVEQTPPSLTASDFTRTSELIEFHPVDNVYTQQDFRASVESEDNGVDLQTVLLFDYGIEISANSQGQGPWLAAVPGSPVDATTLAAGPREISIPFTPNDLVHAVGCHTVTMLVTHQFKQEQGAFYCPAQVDDVATLTWFVSLCENGTNECPTDNCPVKAGEGSYCTIEAPP